MPDRLKTALLKKALVDSFAGAIAVGVLISLSIDRLVAALIIPLSAWMQQRAMEQNMQAYSGLIGARTNNPLFVVVPQFATALVLLAISLALVKWLYYPEAEQAIDEEMPEPGEGG